MSRTILFLCTGNYYRSRFAEELFNHLAGQIGLDWKATSRALAVELGTWNVGPISQHTHLALSHRNIPLAEPVRDPIRCTNDDLAAADRIIALKETEHRPYVESRQLWANRVEYWQVHDLDRATADEALPQIENHVRAVIESLRPVGKDLSPQMNTDGHR